jgi:hypothetical protein
VPQRDRGLKQEKGKQGAGPQNHDGHAYEPVSISQDPGTRGVSLSESVCGPNTPAHLSNFQRMMSNTSEPSSASPEDAHHSYQPSSGPQADAVPHHLRKPSPDRMANCDPTARPWARMPHRDDSPSLSHKRDSNALRCSDSLETASHSSLEHSESRYTVAAPRWEAKPGDAGAPLPPRYGANADGPAQRAGLPPLPQGAGGSSAPSPDGSSTVSAIKTPPTPPQQGACEAQPVPPVPPPPPAPKTLQELSPFDAQRMMPFDDGTTPRSSSSDQSSNRRGLTSEEASPHAPDPGSAHSGDRGRGASETYFREGAVPQHDGPVSRGSSVNSRHGLLTLELRQTLASRSSSAMSRGSASSGSGGRDACRSDPMVLSENSNLSIRTAIRQRAENQSVMNPDWSGGHSSGGGAPVPRGPAMGTLPPPGPGSNFRPASQPSGKEVCACLNAPV